MSLSSVPSVNQQLGSSYSQSNGFITDISIQPYIRAQQLVIRAKGMKVNTPVSTWFDGVNVDKYMSSPNVLELQNVKGTFKEDDVLVYYNNEASAYQAFATVVSVYNYPGTSNTRLYIASDFHTGLTNTTTNSVVSNALFNSSGNYVSNTAMGQLTTTGTQAVHLSGGISSVGGSFTDVSSNTVSLYRQSNGNYCAYLNGHGVWNTPVAAPGSNFISTWSVYFPYTGTYEIFGSCDNDGYFYIDGVQVLHAPTYGSAATANITVTQGTHTVKCAGYNFGGPGSVACTITGPGNPVGGPIYFDLCNPPATFPTAAGTDYAMPGGGNYFNGATVVGLSALASSVDNYYNGAKINITSTRVTQDNKGNVGKITKTFTANVVSYVGSTRLATLDAPVDVSIGFNSKTNSTVTSSYSLTGTTTSYLLAVKNGSGLPSLSTNENGIFTAIFNLPDSTFKTGDRVFRVDNRLVPTDGGASATTWAEATFTASSLVSKTSGSDFSPSVSAAKNTFTATAKQSNLINTLNVQNPFDPIAQTFMIDAKNYPNGCFLASLKLFFASKPTSSMAPITLSIVHTLNGYPDGDTLDNSVVTMTPDQVNVSATPHYLDPTSATLFTFPAPVYIQPGVLYAFMLHSQSADYELYAAAQNATAISSSVKNLPSDPTPTAITKIGTAPYIGALFESQNSITWTANQAESLMFVLDRCVFDTTKTPKIAFTIPYGLPTRKLGNQDLAAFYDPTLVSAAVSQVTGANKESDAYNISTTDFSPSGTSLSYTFLATLQSTGLPDVELPVVPGRYGSPTYDNIYLADGKGPRQLTANSSNSFVLYATLGSTDNTMSPVLADDGMSLYNLDWIINNLSLSNNVITLVNGGTGYDSTNSNTTVAISAPDLVGGTQAYATANVANGVVQSVSITTGGSGYLKAPTITISDANTVPGSGANVVAVSEFSASGGNALCRYLTKKVTLAPGNDSQDLRVFFTAYRPSGTNIYVFYKLKAGNDTQPFETNQWQLMTLVNGTNGYSTDRTNLLEFEAAPGVNGVANNNVSYTNSQGTIFNNFNQFALKIVMTTADNTMVPVLTNMRALALPSGTGI